MADYANLYRRLATLTDSGISIREAFSLLAETESARFKTGFKTAIEVLDRGGNLKSSLRAARLFPEFEIQWMAAGDMSGKLPSAFLSLSEERENERRRIRSFLGHILYPIVLLHAAILLPNLVLLVQKGVREYLETVGSWLFLLYAFSALPFAVYGIAKRLPGVDIVFERILLGVPLLGTFLWKYHLARALSLFHGLYSSGVPALTSLEQVTVSTQSLYLRAVLKRVSKRVQAKMTLREAFSKEPSIPKETKDLIVTGEVSGKLDTTLPAARNLLYREAEAALRTLTILCGAIAFLSVAVLIAYQVISMYMNYFKTIDSLIRK